MNPLSGDLSVMRQTLLFGGLESIAHNVNRRATDLLFYEFGNVYSADPTKEITAERPLAPFEEHASLGIWMTGDAILAGWNRQKQAVSVYDLKRNVLEIMRRLGIALPSLRLTQESDGVFTALLRIETKAGKRLGVLGIVRQSILKKFDIGQEVCFAELNWDELVKLSAKVTVTYTPLPRTQPVRRDLALLLDKDVLFQTVEEAIRKAGGKLLRSVTLFDVYEGKNLPEGKKSYAVAMTVQDDEKTLKDAQIDAVMKKIIAAVKKLGAELR